MVAWLIQSGPSAANPTGAPTDSARLPSDASTLPRRGPSFSCGSRRSGVSPPDAGYRAR